MIALPPRLRGFVLSAAAFSAVLLVTQLLRSGTDQGTPAAILFLGVVYGLLNGLIAAGIILIYRTNRIINFAQSAIGAAGGVFTYNLVVARTTGLPFIPAFLLGLVVAGLVGVIVDLAFIRRFFDASRLVLTVATIALVPALGFGARFVRFLPIFGEAEDRSLLEVVGAAEVTLPFESFTFRIGGYSFPFGFQHLLAIGASVLALAGLAAFFRFTRSGVAVRAASENSDRAMLLGINVRGLSTIVWGIAGVLSGLGVILTAMVSESFQAVGSAAPSALIAALAAAVIAGMRSLPVAVSAAVGLEVLRQSWDWVVNDPEQLALFDLLVFGVILVGLLLQRREAARSEEREVSSWEATEEQRPLPKELREITGVSLWRWLLIGVGVLTIVVFPWVAPSGPVNAAGYIALAGIAILSLVVLTGWAGQVSLGQFALVGVGALLGGALTQKWGVTFWLALPLGAVATAGVSLLIGLPALRIKGLYLAVTTYALAFAVESNLFNPRYFGWMIPSSVERPRLFFFDFDDERSMYYLALGAFLLAALMVTTLRRSRFGRFLIGLRENEANVRSLGVSAVRMRLTAFAISGFLCGFAGVILAHHQRAVAKTSFPALESLNVFIFAVIGGIGSVAGAVLGSVYFALNRIFGNNEFLTLLIGPLGLLLLLYVAPGGLSSVVFGLRDAVFRIVAERRQLIVPSLFATIDPNALERRLIFLAEPFSAKGLALLPKDQRYRVDSGLYRERGRAASSQAQVPGEAEAFQAAAQGFEQE